MGLPQVIVSDQGREFNNQLDSSLEGLLGIKRKLTTPYHPQVTNALCTYTWYCDTNTADDNATAYSHLFKIVFTSWCRPMDLTNAGTKHSKTCW